MTEVSIIIVNYHTEKLVSDCIQSVIEKTEGVCYEIIVADNDPSGGLGKLLKETFPAESGEVVPSACDGQFPAESGEVVPSERGGRIRYLPLPDNGGFGAANNEGFRLAEGKYWFCLNPDTLLVNNAMKILYDYMENNPECGACGGNLYHKDMKRALSMRRILPGVFWEISEMYKLHLERIRFGRNTRFNHSERPMEVGYISGADLMLRADLISRIGGFSDEFFMYFEETDLCARIWSSGYTVVSVPGARIIHLEGKSFEEEALNENKLRHYEQSRVAYYRRNLSASRVALVNRIYLYALKRASGKKGYKGELARMRLRLAKEAIGVVQ